VPSAGAAAHYVPGVPGAPYEDAKPELPAGESVRPCVFCTLPPQCRLFVFRQAPRTATHLATLRNSEIVSAVAFSNVNAEHAFTGAKVQVHGGGVTLIWR